MMSPSASIDQAALPSPPRGRGSVWGGLPTHGQSGDQTPSPFLLMGKEGALSRWPLLPIAGGFPC